MSSHVTEQHQPSGASMPLGQRKVAIPRLQNTGQGHSVTKDKRRVPRACTGCRSHKIKCTGERPHCRHCATTNRECVYILPRRDRLKIITERCHQLVGLVRSLRANASVEDNARITEILEAVEEDTSEFRPTIPSSNLDTDIHGSQESRENSGEEHHEDLETESLDVLGENLHTDDARATGFVGKNSEVQWLRTVALAQTERIDEESLGMAPRRRGSYASGSDQVSSFSFWADGENVDVDFFVDPYELPQLETAERLLGCYMLKVHDSFPILPRKAFEDQFRVFFTALQHGNAPRLSPKWQAILNLVFAIGAKYSHLIKTDWRTEERDHQVYQARARAFGLNEFTITAHPDIPQIQSLGLLAFYWLAVGQVNRAWTIIGMALRSAYSLGLHVRNEDPSATEAKREILVRTWWSLYSLERTLSIITGRPTIIVDSCCSVPLPAPVPEERSSESVETAYRMREGSEMTLCSVNFTFPSSSNNINERPMGIEPMETNSGSYFKAVVQLSIMTQNILTSLYSAGTMIRSPGDIQQDTAQLSWRLDQWVSSLPVEFNSQESLGNMSDPYARERMLLGFQLCSARILLTRPCLTGRRQPWREAKVASFARRMADSCIESAKTIVASLPDEPRPDLIYDQGPWWCIVHHIMQAVSVFLLGLSYPSSNSQDHLAMVNYVKKAISWLRTMQDPVAERAYHVALSSFQGVAKRYAVDMSELWNTEGEGPVANRGRNMQQAVPEADLSAYLPAQLTTMASTSTTVPDIPTYAAYSTITAGAAFPPHHGAPIFNEDCYGAR